LLPAPDGGEQRSTVHGGVEEAQRLLDAGAFEPAREQLEVALSDARAHNDRRGEAECLRLLGVAAFGAGDGDTGTSFIRAALRVARAIGDRRLEAACLVDWAIGHWRRAEYAASLTLLDEALAIQVERRRRPGRCLLSGQGLLQEEPASRLGTALGAVVQEVSATAAAERSPSRHGGC
jgi:hypothetical protein